MSMFEFNTILDFLDAKRTEYKNRVHEGISTLNDKEFGETSGKWKAYDEMYMEFLNYMFMKNSEQN